MSREVKFKLNGNQMQMMIEDHWTLLHLLREELGLTLDEVSSRIKFSRTWPRLSVKKASRLC